MAENPDYDPKVFKEFEHDAWDQVSATYHNSFGLLTRQAVEPLLDAVGAREGQAILEVACGSGALAGAAAKQGCRAMGVDLVETMVSEARKLYPEAEFRQGDAEALPFEDAGFSGVVCNFGLLHFPDPEKAIGEAFRVLAPGGRYALTSWCPPDRSAFLALIMGAVQAHGDTSVVPPGPSMFRFADPEKCKKALGAAGFADLAVTEVPVAARFSDTSQVMEPWFKGGARTKALLKRQTESAQKRIVAAIEKGAEAFAKDGGIVIPMPALLASGRKP